MVNINANFKFQSCCEKTNFSLKETINISLVRQENKKGTKIIQEVVRMDKTDADVKFVLQIENHKRGNIYEKPRWREDGEEW